MYSHSLRIRVASKVGSVTSYAAILLKQEQNQANKHMLSAPCSGRHSFSQLPVVHVLTVRDMQKFIEYEIAFF